MRADDAGCACCWPLSGSPDLCAGRSGGRPASRAGCAASSTRRCAAACERPLDPARPQGAQIDVHFAVLPALARNKQPDPVFFFAGGPGQSAIDAGAGRCRRMLGRFTNRRDIVLIDQRGTGRSAPLRATTDDADARRWPSSSTRRASCARLRALPRPAAEAAARRPALLHHDRSRWPMPTRCARALGARAINLVGALVRHARGARVPCASFRSACGAPCSTAWRRPTWCCRRRSRPTTRRRWTRCSRLRGRCARAARAIRSCARAGRRCWLAAARRSSWPHPLTGQPETLDARRATTLLGMVRAPLYVPALAAALPAAIGEAARGRFEPLAGLALALSPAAAASASPKACTSRWSAPRTCRAWPQRRATRRAPTSATPSPRCTTRPARAGRGACRAAFYTLPPAPAATLLLSGGIDPVTPPRHGERVGAGAGRARRAMWSCPTPATA